MLQSLLFFFGPGSGVDNADDALEEVVVIEIVGVEGAHTHDGLIDFDLRETVVLGSKKCLLLGCQWLAGSFVITGLLLLLFFLWSRFLRVDQEAHLVEHLDEGVLLELQEGVTQLGALACKDGLQGVLILQENGLALTTVDKL